MILGEMASDWKQITLWMEKETYLSACFHAFLLMNRREFWLAYTMFSVLQGQ